MGKSPVRAIGLLSGGLDSLLAARLLMDQDIEVGAVTFESPFFGPDRALMGAAQIGVPVEVRDVSDLILRIVEAPPHGYGRNVNPCVDCHAMMFREAGAMMEKQGASFLFSGEVLGQRPFSQNYKALRLVAKLSGYAERIVRPLSAKLLPKTAPEAEGLVDRERLLSIQGRSRARQMALAREWGIREYASPAGGCCLTDPGYAARLRDLLAHERPLSRRGVELLKLGRHFRLGDRVKAVVGRNRPENAALLNLTAPEEALLEVTSHPSPVVLVTGPHTEGDLLRAASMAVRYSDAPADREIPVRVVKGGTVWTLSACGASDEVLNELRV